MLTTDFLSIHNSLANHSPARDTYSLSRNHCAMHHHDFFAASASTGPLKSSCRSCAPHDARSVKTRAREDACMNTHPLTMGTP